MLLKCSNNILALFVLLENSIIVSQAHQSSQRAISCTALFLIALFDCNPVESVNVVKAHAKALRCSLFDLKENEP